MTASLRRPSPVLIVVFGLMCATLAAAAERADAAITPSRDAVAITNALNGNATATGATFNPLAPTPQCSNGVDDDFNGDTDHPADAGCSSAQDNLEEEEDPFFTAPQCSNGDDDDFDELTDFPNDPQCVSAADNDEELAGAQPPECSNGDDDDFDDLTDHPNDPGCSSTSDNYEGSEGEPFPVSSALAVSDVPLTTFPTHGSTYAIFTNGDPTLADNRNNDTGSGEDLSGPSVRGDSDQDVSVMRINLNVPSGANCLSFDFRFLSEEYPEYVGQDYNDAFIAELDASTWTTTASEIQADNNFATDENGEVISINSTGNTSVEPARADGTTYDAGTRLLEAATPVTPGAHQLYLSIFDQGDGILDAAAFVDNLTVSTRAAGECESGASPVADEPNTKITAGPDGNTKDRTPTFRFKAIPDAPGTTFECKVDKKPFQSCSSPETTSRLSFGRHKFFARAIATDPDLTPAKRAFKVVR